MTKALHTPESQWCLSILVATAQDKTSSTGTGIASGTTAANAGKVFLMTSQRELAETFGDPVFKTDASKGNPIHGGETNEFGLQAAYSLLGVTTEHSKLLEQM